MFLSDSHQPSRCVTYSPARPRLIAPPVNHAPLTNHHQQFFTSFNLTRRIIVARVSAAPPHDPTKKTGPKPATSPVVAKSPSCTTARPDRTILVSFSCFSAMLLM